MLGIAIGLGFLGLCLGSFAGALAWRLHSGKDWITARSQCEKCGHKLSPADLIPVFSWLYLKGCCRYCKKKLSWQYPLIELGLAAAFAATYLLWPGGIDGSGDVLLLATWLVCLVGLLILLIYDFYWMLLPSTVLYTTAAVAVAGRFVYIIGFEPDKGGAILAWATSIGVASGIFGLIYIISRGRWIGDGDISLGIITGTLLADPGKSFLMIFIASILGCMVALPAIITGKKDLSAKLPFGPFLIISTVLTMLFGGEIINWYKGLLLL
ncbi:MAG: prepilin peptidase [Candidatus Saccharimonadales bacterium]